MRTSVCFFVQYVIICFQNKCSVFQKADTKRKFFFVVLRIRHIKSAKSKKKYKEKEIEKYE